MGYLVKNYIWLQRLFLWESEVPLGLSLSVKQLLSAAETAVDSGIVAVPTIK